MNEHDGVAEEQLRAQLRLLVADVEPAPDALPKLLSRTRRRNAPRMRLFLAVTAVAVVCSVFAIALVNLSAPPQPNMVSLRPGSYLAVPQPGVITSFDVFSGRPGAEVARLRGEVTGLARDHQRVYARIGTPTGSRILEVTAGRQLPLAEAGPGGVLAAGGGLVAYPDGDEVVVQGNGTRRIPVPAGSRVIDLALAADGRLAMLTEQPGQQPSVLVLPAGATALSPNVVLRTDTCGPVAISWSGPQLAALQVGCERPGHAQVATFTADTGQKVGAGATFASPALKTNEVHLSTDNLGRYLVSTPTAGQWIIDGTDTQSIPPACTTTCTATPATF